MRMERVKARDWLAGQSLCYQLLREPTKGDRDLEAQGEESKMQSPKGNLQEVGRCGLRARGKMESKISAVEEKGLSEHRWAMGIAPPVSGAQVLGKEHWDEVGRATLGDIFQASLNILYQVLLLPAVLLPPEFSHQASGLGAALWPLRELLPTSWL